MMLRSALLACLATAPIAAQGQGTFVITSRALGEDRTIDVALPRGYQAGTDRYPVIVVLDGESVHAMASTLAGFYAATGVMPRAIVVGVRNTNRMRDLTPTPVAGFNIPPEARGAGGADRFTAFLQDELVPHLDSSYRTVPMRVLVGHSLGGLFALHVMVQRPSLFTGIVAMEPSTWWNNQHEWRRATQAIRGAANRRTRLILVNTERMDADTTAWGGSAAMVRHRDVKGETHESMPPSGMIAAFRALFEDFRPLAWKPGTRPVAMLERYDSLAQRVGYAVPIPEPAYAQTIRMSIHARHFDDAERMLARMASAFGETQSLRGLREMLAEERTAPLPAGWIPLEIPPARPTPVQARAFVGSWEIVGAERGHEIDVRASGDTIVVHSRIQFPDGTWEEGDRHVIQVTPGGTLEWGLAWFRGIAALVVQKATILPDGTMRVERESRGWVPRGPDDGMIRRVEIFRRRS